MKAVRRDEGKVVFGRDGVGEIRSSEAGAMTVEFGSVVQAIDPAPLFRGLPDDMCQCHHFGYVIRGTYKFRGKDGEVEFCEGDAFYVTPGHIPLPQDGCEWVAFTDSAEQRLTNEAIAANSAAVK